MSLLTKTAQAMLVSLVMWLAVPNARAEGSQTYTFTIERTMDQTEPTVCQIHETVLKANLNMETLNFSKLKVYSVQASGKVTTSHSVQPLGNYFSSTGNVTTTKTRAIGYITFETQSKIFNVMHYTKAVYGETYTMREVIINEETNDSVFYVFNMTMGDKQSVSSDEPAFIHRADKMDAWRALPFVKVNDQAGETNYCVQGNVGDNITFGVRPRNEGDVVSMKLTSPSGEKLVRYYSDEDFTLNSIELDDAGYYTCNLRVTADGHSYFQNFDFVVDIQTHQGEYFDWDADGPYWSYDFRDEYESIPQPTKHHNFYKANGQAANQVHGDWWSVYWGDNLNSECGDAATAKKAMENAVAKYETDFAYIRNEMGWPPDINARQGWTSFVYVLGSGLQGDGTSPDETGGWQGSKYADGRSWPCVTATYYPMSRFRDDASSRYSDVSYQTEAMIHEGIHAIFADYPGCKKSAWFQEAGNTWLQGAMSARRGQGAQVSGWLGVGNLICPFMPIECYSGWLQDGSFGGPAAEGVNMYNGSQQICTWRNLIGGVQYGETFPIFLGLNVGIGSVPWIWRYCTDYVLKGIAQGNASEGVEGIGDEGIRQLILHYRAKLATMDFKESSNGMRNLLNNSFGTVVKAEWEPYWIDVAPFTLTPYQTLTLNDAEGWMAPDPITNPGWSGGNIIPIHVGKNGCEVFFRPEDENMRCQLCYRTRDGRTFYSQPVICGKMVLNWDDTNQPANGVAFIVPCNTDYIYTGDDQRKKHWDYRIKLGRGAYAPADIYQRWYFYEQTITDPTFDYTIPTAIEEVTPNVVNTNDNGQFRILTSILKGGQKVQLALGDVPGNEVTAHLVGLAGVVIDEQKVADDGTVQLPAFLNRGMYVLALEYQGKVQSFKVFAE